MTAEPERVVQLFVGEGERRRAGSGYLVAPGLVLTAAHVLGAGGRCRAAGGLPPGALWKAEADTATARCDDDADVALLALDGGPQGDFERAGLGRLGERGARVEAIAVGFPRWKLRDGGPGGPYRDSHAAAGRIDPLSNRRGGTLELIVDGHPEPDPDPARSAWEAMSGAAVWVRGRIVGVVAEHHAAEGRAMLACRPLSAVRARVVADALDLPDALADVGSHDPYDELLDVHRRQWLERCPHDAAGVPRLEGRKAELAALADFCAGDADYLWIQGQPWAGKTALSAAFALAPPDGVTALAVFVSERLPGDALLDVCLRLLGALLRRPVDGVATLDEKGALLGKLLDAAAAAQRRLVLIVDGLDEDPRPPGSPPIARLLPRALPPGAKLVVTSRPGLQAPAGHPLEALRPIVLKPSGAARDAARLARAEVNGLLDHPPEAASDLLGLLSVADGLSAGELAELMQPPEPPGRVTLLLDERVGRVFTALDEPDARRYVFAHAELHAAARAFFGAPHLERLAARIDAWVDGYAQKGWPEATPAFCLGRYLDLLRARGDGPRLAALASDRERRERLLARTGSHVAATAQCVAALRALAQAGQPDLEGATRLALTGFALRRHVADSADPEMVGFLVRIGRAQEAIAALEAVSPDDLAWGSRVARLAASLYEAGADGDAEDVLDRIASRGTSDLRGEVAALVARKRPEVALRLLEASGLGPPQRLLAELARHDNHVDDAIALAGAELDARLAIARALAPRRPDQALAVIAGAEHGFEERSGGETCSRGPAFARVEVARLTGDDQVALRVLLAELEGADRGAALVAAVARLARADARRAAELIEAHTEPYDVLRALARLTLGDAAPEEPAPEQLCWDDRDLDVVARLGPQLAAHGAAYEALLRTLLEPNAIMPDVEHGDQAACTVLTELACLDALRDGDAAALAETFGAQGAKKYEAFEAAARRIAAREPRRAWALALRSGPAQTWVLRDIVTAAAPTDPAAALALIDSIERRNTATRSILLGALGACVDPDDEARMAELWRRLPRLEEAEAADATAADAAVRLAGLLHPGDRRAQDLLTRFEERASSPAQERSRADRAVRLAATDPYGAVDLLETIEPEHRAAARAVGEAALAMAPVLPEALATDVLERAARMPLGGDTREATLSALARLDAPRALRAATEWYVRPEVLARALAAGVASAGGPPGVLTALEEEAARLAQDLDGVQAAAVALAVAQVAGRPLAAAVSSPDPEEADDVAALTIPRTPPDAWPGVLARAAAPRGQGFNPKAPAERVGRMVDAMARVDPAAAFAAIDATDWDRIESVGVPSVMEGVARERAVPYLAARDWQAAFDRARVIEDRYCARDALADVGAAIPRDRPPAERARALREVLDAAAQRLASFDDVADQLMTLLRARGTVDRAMQLEILAETTRWPTDSGVWRLGEAVALVPQDLESVGAAVDGLYAALADLGG